MEPHLYRNIGIMAHVDAGKTTLSERLLFFAGASTVMGDVDDGTTVMDWRADEQERGITVSAASAGFSWRGLHINLVDTPGHVDFSVEVGRVLRVMDGAIVVLSGIDGVESQTEAVWREADVQGLPRLVFVNKLDRDGATFLGPLVELEERLGVRPVPFVLPVHDSEGVDGVVDLHGRRWLRFPRDRRAGTVVTAAVPEHLREQAESLRASVVETLCDHDEAAMEAYVECGDLTPAEFSAAARRATLARTIVPVFGGSALASQGIQPLLDAIVGLLPSPVDRGQVRGRSPATGGNLVFSPARDSPLCALCFKRSFLGVNRPVDFVRIYSGSMVRGQEVVNGRTGQRLRLESLVRVFSNEQEDVETAAVGDIVGLVGVSGLATGDALASDQQVLLEGVRIPRPVIQAALEVASSHHQAALARALLELASEDPTVEIGHDASTGRSTVTAMGELHLEIIRERLEREYGLDVQLGTPRATLAHTVEGRLVVEVVRSKEVDGTVSTLWMRVIVRPEPRGGAAIVSLSPALDLAPHQRRLLETALVQALQAGATGEPLVDLAVQVDGIRWEGPAASLLVPAISGDAVARLFDERALVALEPEMKVVIWTPKDYVGRVLGDLSRRGGVVQGTDFRVGGQELTATVPLSRMFGFATHLRSLSQGRATFHMHFLGYRPINA